jgi:hypothetical protein
MGSRLTKLLFVAAFLSPMAITRGLILCAIAALFHFKGFSAIQQSTNDLWDVSSGASISASSGFQAGFHGADMFGSNLSIENGHAVFDDGHLNGYTHYVEWQTPEPIALTGFNLFAAGDGATYNNEREFGLFVLKAKRHTTDEFTTIYSFNPTHPYVFLDAISHAIVSASLPQTVEAQFFRAEFVQQDAGRGFDGPRVIELDGFGSRIQPVTSTVADWTFEEGTPGHVATAVADYSGNSHTGHVNGTAFYRFGQVPENGAVSLELSGGSHFSPENSEAFNFKTNDFTLETILNPGPGNIDANRGIIVAQNPVNGGLSYVLDYRTETRAINFALVGANGLSDFVTATIPNDGGPHHVAATRRGNDLSIYLDKRLIQTKSITVIPNLPVSGPVALRIGASSAGYWFGGVLDRVRISRGALSVSDFVPFEGATVRNPIADWTFEEGTPGTAATTVLDESGNGHHGQVHGDVRFMNSELSAGGAVSIALSTGGHFAPLPSEAFNFKTNSFTLEAILNPGLGNTDANRGVVVVQNPENGGLSCVVDYRTENRTVNFALVAASGFNEFVTAVIPDDGIPHHVAATRRGNILSIYLDKRLVQSKTVTVIPNLPGTGPVALRVGASSAGYWFEGVLDRVRISRGALEPSEFIDYQPPAFRIIEQPQSQSVVVGANVNFAVTVSSNITPAYQWFFNGTPLAGKNARVLALTNIQPANAGTYSVQISASGQTITSAPARLTVTPPPSGGPVKNDLFDISEGNQITRHSGIFPTIRVAGLFGDEGPSIEKGSTIFADDKPDGYAHFVEWRTASPVILRRIKLFAAGDGAVYFNEREFRSFTLKAKSSSSSATFDHVLYTYDATHPYSFLNPTNRLLIDAPLDATVAQEFRAEFVQWNAGRGYDGPRIIELDGFGERVESLSATVADWTFEEGIPGSSVQGALDSSGNQHDITQVLGPSARFVESGAEVNGAISVSLPAVQGGLGNALRANDSIDFSLGTEFTVEASLNPGANNVEFNRGIIVGQDATSGRLVYGLDYRSENRVVDFLVADAAGQIDAVQATIPDDGRSHHVAGVFSGGMLKVYLDKALVESQSTRLVPGLTPGGAGRVTLGANDIGGYWFNGSLDRVRISREALSPEEFFPTDGEPTSPLVISQPLQNLSVREGDNATFHVGASGGTNLTYRWAFSGQTLSNQTSDTFVLNNARLADAGTYTVTVRSGPWEVSSSATLTVTGAGAGAPIISAHPQSRLTGLGQSAQFSVSATGTGPLTYQWFFNGGTIPGETNATLWVVGVTAEQAGTYHVVVSNASGSTTSRAAVLNVFSSSITGGEIYMDNHTADVDAPIFTDTGIRLTGPEFLAQLYAGVNESSLQPVGAAIPFGTGENAGFFSDVIARIIPGTTSGTPVAAQVVAWDSRAGRTYEQAAENRGLHGASQKIAVVAGGGTRAPATLTGLQSFSLYSRPRITQQPTDISVKQGRAAVFQVNASGSMPLAYQWRFNDVAMAGQTSSTLVVSNATELNAGRYTVEVHNNVGSVTSAPARLTVLPRDTQPPIVTLTSPAAGTNTSSRVTIAGTVSDNGAIVRVEWLRNGQLVGPIPLNSGSFSLPEVLLLPGTNNFTIAAYDDDGNLGSAAVSAVFDAQRALWVEKVSAVQEGAHVFIPILVNSSGDIGALSFTLSYDSNSLADARLDWSNVQGNSFTQVNTDEPGVIRATYVLPGKTIRPGTNTLAIAGFRARSVPETLNSMLKLEVQGIYSATGDPITSGTTVSSGEVQILRRRVVGDNNANDRLDVGDATSIIRMLTSLEPTRPWDVTGNDLNQNALLDPGDAIRVLRAVVNLDRQPTVPGNRGLMQPVEGTLAPYFVLSSDTNRLVPGDKIKVRVDLGVLFPINGASVRVNYPTNALHLDSAEALATGPLVPSGAMTLWNVAPDQDYASQNGEVNFAASAAAAWQNHNGTLAELTFTVQPDAANQRFWTLTTSQGEVAAGIDVDLSTSSELVLEGRDAKPARLTVGELNPATGAFELTIAGDAGARYKIEASEDLRTWTQISVTSADSGVIRITDSPSTPAAHRFYRAVEVQ